MAAVWTEIQGVYLCCCSCTTELLPLIRHVGGDSCDWGQWDGVRVHASSHEHALAIQVLCLQNCWLICRSNKRHRVRKRVILVAAFIPRMSLQEKTPKYLQPLPAETKENTAGSLTAVRVAVQYLLQEIKPKYYPSQIDTNSLHH